MEMKAEGLQAGRTGGGGGVHSLHGTHFCTSVEFTANMGERSMCRPPPDDSLEGGSTPVYGGRLRHRGVGELARRETAAGWPWARPPGADYPE